MKQEMHRVIYRGPTINSATSFYHHGMTGYARSYGPNAVGGWDFIADGDFDEDPSQARDVLCGVKTEDLYFPKS